MAIHRNLDSIKNLLSALDKPLMQPKCDEQFKLNEATRSFHKKIYLLFICMAFQIWAFFVAVPFFVDERIMVLPGWFPFDWKVSPYYEMIYVFHTLVLLWICFLGANVTTFSFGLMMQVGLQCDYLTVVLESLDDFHVHHGILLCNIDEDDKRMMKQHPRQFSRVITENLIICIRHHQEIQRLARDVEDIHRVSIFIMFLGASLTICSDLFQLTKVTFEGDTAKFLVLSSLLNCMLIQQYMYCWFGNEIIEKSRNIFTSAFNTPWIDCDLKFKKLLLNFSSQAMKPIEIKVGGLFTMSNAVFISVTFEGDTAKFLVLSSLLNCMLIQQYMYCWFGNEIIEKSRNIFTSAFNTPWIDCDLKFKKLLLNFSSQAMKPIEIKVGGLFTMSNAVFISKLETSTEMPITYEGPLRNYLK
ncbi:unnamed protein product [Phaedon cochleariae]|uniref:Odorant receptor n=1 Tax=Phaedon cochleariae TaxID=80249 RepID=A0A9N9X1F0_PHACE|nr:unnamed protein product [Phaedon cochleariae]